MSAGTSTSSGGGVSLVGLLAILFIALKLTGVIGWSWWWVLAPLWGGFALAAVIALVGLALMGVAALVGLALRKPKRRRSF
jgi:hypothetical protein